MTRINCVPPSELHDKHLLAEYRELPRVFRLAERAFARGDHCHAQHPVYTLGKGHVLFFYTRLGYLEARFKQIVQEMRDRDFMPIWNNTPYVDVSHSWFLYWTPTTEALIINRERLLLRMPKNGSKRYPLPKGST